MEEAAPNPTLADRVAGVRWYHSLALPDGLVTPGSFDSRDELQHLPFPTSLDGERCLDVATADGFWAFEMERRGAAEVIAIDVAPSRQDWPWNTVNGPGGGATSSKTRGFDIAHDAFESRVQWKELSVYELDPSQIGEFDFIFIGSLLGHLRDPVAALSAIASVLRGELLSVDAISAPLTLVHPRQPLARFEAPGWPLWWVPNLEAYRQLFGAAGMEIVASGRPFFLKRGPTHSATPASVAVNRRLPLHGRLRRAVGARLGNPHAWVRATGGKSTRVDHQEGSADRSIQPRRAPKLTRRAAAITSSGSAPVTSNVAK
jgi:tRNA (mo5U34)-methyltransferase